MINQTQKQAILNLIEREKDILGSYSKVATKAGVAIATITNQMKNPDRWPLVKDTMWVKVGKALGFTFQKREWKLVETTNSRLMASVLKLAQEESMFIAISEKAGSGKTAGIASYKHEDETNMVFVLQCEEWTKKQFLSALAQSLGLTDFTGNCLRIGNLIISALKERAAIGQPLLILDEADKLRPSALRFIIHFYNNLEDECGLVICGTDNLEKEIKRGVLKASKGYDEIDSRLGRKFVHLHGISEKDCINICRANGISDSGTISRIWKECEPKDRLISGKYLEIISDLRRLKRIVQREIKTSSFVTPAASESLNISNVQPPILN